MRLVLPGGSPNLDELAYQQQAAAIAHGYLTLPSEQYGSALRPYLSGFNDDGEVVFKYQPLWPAMVAGADSIGLTSQGLRLMMASLLPAVGAWLAWETLGRRRRPANITAWLLALCPMVWAQSASLLAYQPSVVFVTAALAAYLTYQRTGHRVIGLLCGLASAAAVFHRAFDAVVVIGTAVIAYLLIGRRRSALLATIRLVPVAALGPIAIGLYNNRVTGSPFRPPFNLAGGSDHFGFGRRSSYPINGIEPPNFTVVQGVRAMAASMVQFGAWAPLGLLGVALALTTAWRHRSRTMHWVLLAPTLALTLAYVSWWGSANLTTFNLHRMHGPAYHYFAVVPIAVLAASAIDELRRHDVGRTRRVIGGVLAAGLLIVSTVWAQSNLTFARHTSQARNAAQAALSNAGESGVVFVEPAHSLVDGRLADQPYLRVLLPDLVDSRPLVALDLVSRRAQTMAELGATEAVVAQQLAPFGQYFAEGSAHVQTAEVEFVTGRWLELVLTVEDRSRVATAFLQRDRDIELLPLDALGRARVSVASDTLGTAATLVIGVLFADVDDPRNNDGLEQIACTVDVSVSAGVVTAALPCRSTHRYVFPDGTWLDAPEQIPISVAVRAVS